MVSQKRKERNREPIQRNKGNFPNLRKVLNMFKKLIKY